MDFGLGLLIFGWIFVIIWVPLIITSQRKIHPKALFTLFFAELWERFSFYGMRAILILYMTQVLFEKIAQGEADARAYGIYGAYNALLYAAPLVGGILADRIMGFRKAIILGGIFMALGQFTLAYNAGFVAHELVFFAGLGLLTVGNGFFKPNISSFLGTFYEQNDKRKDSAFTLFYMGINVGAFLAPLTCGYLAQAVDWSLGFFVAGIGMVVGLIVFWINKGRGVLEDKGLPPDPEAVSRPYVAGLSKYALIVIGAVLTVPIFAFLIDAEEITDYILLVVGGAVILYLIYTSVTAEDKVNGQRMLVFIALFFFHMIFWALFEQAGGSLNILTERYVNKHGIEASQFQSLNPLYIILLAPVFSWIWRKLSISGREPRTPIKFFMGLIQMAIGYFVIVLGVKAGIAAGAGANTIPVFFLLFMYLFHTTGELSLSPVGLSVVTKLSVPKVVGFVMGAWFLSIAFAHKIAGNLGKLIATPTNGQQDGVSQLNAFMDVYLYWGVYVVLGAAVVLLLLSPILRKWMHGVH
jgi:POT family proton-dependent oligopeptide transporter